MASDTGAFLDLATDLAKRSGKIMRDNFAAGMKKEWKHDNTPLTETDLAINDLVVKTLCEAYPGHGILSEEEEEKHMEPSQEYVWICDPVDGTHNFSHGIPTATFALVLTHRGRPVVSVVYDPFMDRLFSAEKGKGAYLNGKPIRVSENTKLKHTAIGMGKMNDVRNFMPVMDVLRKEGAMVVTGLSIHFMTALVAVGEMGASFFGGRTVHDMTAGTLLVEEAGGRATDIFGKTPARYDEEFQGQLCTNGLLHDDILAIMDRVSPTT